MLNRLLFFNKEGDNLNFNYSSNDRYEGTLMFPENSTDIYKTTGLYVLEEVPSFEYEYDGVLNLNKFQLFNEYGFNFYNSTHNNLQIERIEPVNTDPNFYSKWIYGEQFNVLFPIGNIIIFNEPLLGFSTNYPYMIVGSKPNAIMIISNMDNNTFETLYSNQYIYENTYINKSISSINALGIYKYINTDLSQSLSNWSEPNFYDKLYINKKLNIIGSDLNDGVVTINNTILTDNIYHEYKSDTELTSNLIIKIELKTDLPMIYNGGLELNDNVIKFEKSVPTILKPNIEFKIVGSTLNANFLTIADIPYFNNNKLTYYDLNSQVLYDNKIYECIQAYTQSIGNTETGSITPEDINYWTENITYIKTNQILNTENIQGQIYLTTNVLYFEQEFTTDTKTTYLLAIENFKNDFSNFNIDLYYKEGLIAKLKYSSNYAIVDFYDGSLSNKIGTSNQIYEKIIGTNEQLLLEYNNNYSTIKKLNIVFKDLDEYGLKINIDRQIYEEQINWVYSGTAPDMERTIDRTLRSWLTRNYVELQKLGIIATLQYIGTYISPFYNSIKLSTDYPNINLSIKVMVGTTANYHIEHSTILFNEMGKYLSININDEIYDINASINIPTTLENWVSEYYEELFINGIIVSNINNLLIFNILNTEKRLDYIINNGISNIKNEGIIITNKILGNNGVLITSNEVKLVNGTQSLIDAGFSTGMAFSINNTYHTPVNSEFNIQYLNNDTINLSYQGPFWGTIADTCDVSPFTTLSFEIGYGATGCDPIVGPTESGNGGEFNKVQFSSAFNLLYNANKYSTEIYNIDNNNLVDIIYIQLSNSIYAFGDNLSILDAFLNVNLSEIELIGNTNSLFMRFNIINNYLYCVSKNIIYVIDPLLNIVIDTWTYIQDITSVEMNTINGDIYIGVGGTIEIRNSVGVIETTLSNTSPNFPIDATTIKSMVFNTFENKMYIMVDSTDSILLINSNRIIETKYGILGATGSMYYEPINESIYIYGSANLYKIDNGEIISIPSVITSDFNDIIFNNLTSELNISSNTTFKGLQLDTNNLSYETSVGNSGYLALNEYDGAVYLSSNSTNVILCINPITGKILHTESLSEMSGKIIYNLERKSIWTILSNSIVELSVELKGSINPIYNNYEIADDNRYGTLDPNYIAHKSIWLKTREYLRKPRENYSNDVKVQYYWKWYSDDVPEFFLYDFSGNQLGTGGSYSYIGEKPLTNIVLNKEPNMDITKISQPEYQQTIFDTITWDIDYIDSVDNISTNPEPLELFIGFKAEEEGAIRSVLQLYKKEDINIEYISTNDLYLTFETLDVNGDKYGQITINTDSIENFFDTNLKSGQLIAIYVKDNTNESNQYISSNNGTVVKIRDVYYKKLIVDFLSVDDYLFLENSKIIDNNRTTYCKVSLKVIDKEIGRFITYGQTEIEDIRFKIELGNVGKLIAPNEIFIFKDYDILEGGIDWTFLNKKRKEMLMMKHLIYPYIGAYKSIINSINFFGYNDLKLNEYFRNINPSDDNFLKLFKVEIPDIFDNTIEGWTENDFVLNNFPNENYEETNMFNLSYDITDKEGNININYSIDEVIIKLQGLKYWLKRNIIPLTHKILDITGQANFVAGTDIIHTSYDTTIVNINQNITPITFKLNEAYLLPINSGSSVYNCVLDFYTIIDSDTKSYNGSELILPDYYDIKIRTYKTYKEWSPFTIYNINDRIIYYSKIYESLENINKLNNPRLYENVNNWVSGKTYSITNLVKYDNDIYEFVNSTPQTETISPYNNPNWIRVNKWREIDYEPVQTINEFRYVDTTIEIPLLPFNFTIDSNIDPFISIEVKCDNGYGLSYIDMKNYEIRGNKDLRDTTTIIDKIGQFVPIIII